MKKITANVWEKFSQVPGWIWLLHMWWCGGQVWYYFFFQKEKKSDLTLVCPLPAGNTTANISITSATSLRNLYVLAPVWVFWNNIYITLHSMASLMWEILKKLHYSEICHAKQSNRKSTVNFRLQKLPHVQRADCCCFSNELEVYLLKNCAVCLLLGYIRKMAPLCDRCGEHINKLNEQVSVMRKEIKNLRYVYNIAHNVQVSIYLCWHDLSQYFICRLM